jgi:hypothetical protein
MKETPPPRVHPRQRNTILLLLLLLRPLLPGLTIVLLALSAIGTFSGQTGVSTLECGQPRPLCLVLRYCAMAPH